MNKRPIRHRLPRHRVRLEPKDHDCWDEHPLLEDLTDAEAVFGGEVDEGEDSDYDENLPALFRAPERNLPARDCLDISGYPVWQRRVELEGETTLAVDDFDLRRPVRLEPIEVTFSSPPTIDRNIILCGFVTARLTLARRATRRVTLPFQRVLPAWPVRDGDLVKEQFIRFTGSRACPILVTTLAGQVRPALELKAFFTAYVLVFHRRRPICR